LPWFHMIPSVQTMKVLNIYHFLWQERQKKSPCPSTILC
jgi:hypothetical protein